MMKVYIKIFIGLLFLVIGLLSCNDTSYSGIDRQLHDKIIADPGFVLLEQKCMSCHAINPEESSALGPDVYRFVQSYKERYNTIKSFKREMGDFIIKPSRSMAIMKPAIEKYGLMPPVFLNADEINSITQFLYKYNLDDPSWYSTHFANEIKDKKNDDKKLQDLKVHALNTKKALGSELTRAIAEGGTVHAVDYCNISAMPLTDSMSRNEGVMIKRVTDKPRNPSNKASREELALMADFKDMIGQGLPVNGVLSDDKLVAYYPIVTNELCLNCHGDIKNIDAATYQKIKNLYPRDKATGYGNAELRGLWVINKK